MPALQRSVATLRVSGDSLVPESISALLGVAPTHAQTKGETIVYAKGTRTRIAKFGMWRLEASDKEPADLDAQVAELLDQLTPDLTIWRTLAAEFDIELFCGWFMAASNEGETISPETMLRLGERGIDLSTFLVANQPVSPMGMLAVSSQVRRTEAGVL